MYATVKPMSSLGDPDVIADISDRAFIRHMEIRAKTTGRDLTAVIAEIVASQDQRVTHYRAAGWSDICIGAFLALTEFAGANGGVHPHHQDQMFSIVGAHRRVDSERTLDSELPPL